MMTIRSLFDVGAHKKHMILFAVGLVLMTSHAMTREARAASPDLLMTAVSGPTSGLTGGTIAVTNTVTASASGGASRAFNVGIYLSTSSTITTANTRLGSRRVAGLAPGASSTDTTEVTLPVNITPGTYYLGAIADFGDNVLESDETNNALAGNEIVVGGPDLTMTAVSGPTSGLTGGTITVTNTVTASASGGASRAFNVGIYLSPNSTITTTNTRLGSRRVGGLASGALSTDTTAVTLPVNLAPGTYYLGAIADFGDNVPESDETNNALAGNQIVVGGPDLLMTAVSGPTSGLTGGMITVANTVTASASDGASRAFNVGIYLSPSSTITTANRRLGSRHVSGLAPGASSTDTTAVTLPVNIGPGTYYLGAIADFGNNVPESDETNNALAGNQIYIGNDTTPPVGSILINGGAAATNLNAVTLTASAADSQSGLSQMQFSNDNATWSEAEPYAATKSWTLITGDGSKTIYARYKDVAGNWSSACTSSIVLDTMPPIISIASPAAGLTNTTTPLLNYMVSEGSVTVKVDGLVVSKSSGMTLDPLVDGQHTVRLDATDAAGNTGSSMVTFTVDTIAPTVTIFAPTADRFKKNELSLAFAVSEGTPVVYVDGVAVAKASGDHLDALSEGDHTVRVESTDAAGNVGYAMVAFTVEQALQAATSTQSLSLGAYHVLVIKADGTLWAWGDNEHGQLGDGTTVNKNVQMGIGLGSSWKSVSAGGNHSAALTLSGELWTWGYNAYGQLGDGSATDRTEPLRIAADPNNPWSRVIAGSNHTAAIRSDGSLWAWGLNETGQLGDGSTTDRAVPVQIGTERTWTAVAAGTYHTMALKNDGSLWAWGCNAYGELGNGSTDNSASPLQVGQEGTWTAVAAGGYHTVALRSDGTLWAWGLNDAGQLGDGTTRNQAAPVQIGAENRWVAVAAGAFHSLALKSDGTLWTWGMNSSGQLGDGTSIDRYAPTMVATADWRTVAGGMISSAAIQSDGTVAIWGGNGFGQLGNGYSVHRLSPVQIGTDANWRAASGGLGFSLALKIDDTLWAWGDNSHGQFGNGTTAFSSVPMQIGIGQDWDKVAAGEEHALAITKDGRLWGWGHNDKGQIGDGSLTDQRKPVAIVPNARWFAVSAGKGHSLGIQADGRLWAWGDNEFGQLGNGTTTDSALPIHIGQEAAWIAVAAGQRSSYAIRIDGALFAWGAGDVGQLGTSSWDLSTVPVPVDPAWIWYTWDDISAGTSHVLGVRRGEFCGWGKNDHGQLTNGWYHEAYDQNEPMCPDGAWDWLQAAAGQDFSLGRKHDGTIWSWGNNNYGQLGDGTIVERHTPAQIGLGRDWAFIAAGKQHALAIKTDSTLWSWGYNSRGQAGTGDQGAVQRPAIMSMVGAIRINGGAVLTNTPGVSLDLSAIDQSIVAAMQFSNNGIVWSLPETFAINTTWDLNDADYGGSYTDGAKTVYARFQDAAGRESQVFSASITVDTTPPVIMVSSPVNGATYHELPVLLYTISEGAALVQIYGSDPAFESLSSGSPVQYMGGSLRGGGHYITVSATDAAGNSSSTTVQFSMVYTTGGSSGIDPDEAYPNCNGTVKYIVGPSNFTSGIIVPAAGSGLVNISSPENFSTINGSKVIVKGAMDTIVPIKNVTVTVSTALGSSSYPAQVNGKYFAAKVPITADATISVIATDQTGTQRQDSVSVYVNAQGDTVDLAAGPNMGVATLKQDGKATLDVGLMTTLLLPQPARLYEWDLNGIGYPDLTCWSHSTIQVRYEQPGLYESHVFVESGGHRYRDSVIVNVSDRDEMDAIFKPIWNGMKEKLGRQDIEGALGSFHPQSRARYNEIFTALISTLPAMAQDMQNIEIIYVNEMVAKYRIRKNEMYGGQMITLTYYIYFTRDENGMWAIEKF